MIPQQVNKLFWKHNNSLLEDKDYVEKIDTKIEEVKTILHYTTLHYTILHYTTQVSLKFGGAIYIEIPYHYTFLFYVQGCWS